MLRGRKTRQNQPRKKFNSLTTSLHCLFFVLQFPGNSNPYKHSTFKLVVEFISSSFKLDNSISLTDSFNSSSTALLCQRSLFDLLLNQFSLNKIKQIFPIKEDQVSLTTSILTVSCLQEASLNRRVFNWLLGKDKRLRQTAVRLIQTSIQRLFKISDGNNAKSVSIPFEVLSALFDRTEFSHCALNLTVVHSPVFKPFVLLMHCLSRCTCNC